MDQEQIDKLTPKEVRDYVASSRKFREEMRDDPEKAKAFLIRAGICVKNDSCPSGIELAPDLRCREDEDDIELDNAGKPPHNSVMNKRLKDQLTPKVVRDYLAHSKKFLKEIEEDPEKAKAFLIRAGICVKNEKRPSGIELAPRYRG